jgi:general secretion pathway protein G
MTPLRKNQREVLAGLAAVLIVGSFAIPAFNGYVERSRVARAVSEIGTMSLKLHRFQQDTHALPVSLAEAGLGGDDPWGRPYVYVRAAGSRAQLRKDDEFAPLNTDFDLYSLGPDGVSSLALPAAPSRDDVVRAANGAYIGVAVNY